MSRFSSARHSLLARTRVALLALAAGAALVLSGCQGGSTPANTGSTTVSPTASVTPTPSPSPAAVYKPADAKGKAQNVPVPVMPALAKENTKEGLEAFIRYYFQSLSYAYETGDTQLVGPLASPTCVLCSDLKGGVEANYTDGRWLAGGRYQTPVVEARWQPNGVSQAKVQVLQESVSYFNANGSSGRDPGAENNVAAAFYAKYIDGSWTTTDLGLIQ